MKAHVEGERIIWVNKVIHSDKVCGVFIGIAKFGEQGLVKAG